MRRRLLLPLSLGLALAIAPGATRAVSPGPDTRKGLLPLGVCEGGLLDGEHCIDDFDCDEGRVGVGPPAPRRWRSTRCAAC